MKFVEYNNITLLQIQLTHRDPAQHPISDTELTSYAKEYIKHNNIKAEIKEVIHNNKAKALLTNDDLTPACSDLIYKLSNKGVLANFACILCDYKQVKAWSTEDIYNFLAFIYPKEIQANPRAWRSYARKVYEKLQDCKEFLK